MNDTTHIASTRSGKGHEVRQAGHAERQRNREAHSANSAPEAAFGMMMSQAFAAVKRNEPRAAKEEGVPAHDENRSVSHKQKPSRDTEIEQAGASAQLHAVPNQDKAGREESGEDTRSDAATTLDDKGAAADCASAAHKRADKSCKTDVPTDDLPRTDRESSDDRETAFLAEAGEDTKTVTSPLQGAAEMAASEEICPADQTCGRDDLQTTDDAAALSPSVEEVNGDEVSSAQQEADSHEESSGHGMSDNPGSPENQTDNDKTYPPLPEQRNEDGPESPLRTDAPADGAPETNGEQRQVSTQDPLSAVGTDFSAIVRNEARTADAGGMLRTESGAPDRAAAADPAELFDHEVSIVKDGSRLAVTMEHDGLGKLNIDLRMRKGVINAQVLVSDTASKNLIENNIQQIVNTLLGEGLSIGGFSVSLKERGAGDGMPEHRQDNRRTTSSFPPQEPGASAPPAARGLINLFA